MIKNPLVLTFDIGTQSLRAMLVDQKGNIVAIEQNKFQIPYFVKKPGYAEQYPNFYFEQMCDASKKLKQKNPELYKNIIAVTLATIRNTALFLDKDNKPLRNIFMWLDSRRCDAKLPFSEFEVTLFKLIGINKMLTTLYQDFKAVWVKENEPEIWAKTNKFVMLSTYLNYQLTGILKDVPANMIAPVPINVQKKAWQSRNNLRARLTGIPINMMCELMKSGEVIGKITTEASKLLGVPENLDLISSGSDKSSETLGLSVIHENQAAISFGTTSTIQFASKKYFEIAPFSPTFPAIISDQWNPETQIRRGFWLVTWFKKNFAEAECKKAKELGCSPEEILNAKLKDIPVGCDGLMLQPYWGACLLDSTTKGSIVGFSDVHTKYHIYRAIIEGIGLTLLTGLKNMEKRSGQKIEEIFVAGGGAQSKEVCQIMADIFNLPVKTTQTHEACGIGSSVCAFIAKGIYPDYETAVNNMVQIKHTYLPNEENHKKYDMIYNNFYKKVNSRLKPIYHKMRKKTWQ